MEIKTTYLPAVFFKMGQQVLHFVGVPVFFFLFVILYKPFNLSEILSLRHGGFAFNVAIISSILFVVLLITRLTLWGLRNATSFKRRTYFAWCAGEIVISSFFVALYVHLMSGGVYTFIDLVPACLAYLGAVEVFPYLIYTLILDSDIISKYGFNPPQESPRIKFYDERHVLKFVTDPDSLLYIEADENYCNIYYTENGRLNKFILRASLHSLEELCSRFGIQRCHRSFLVNVKKIKVLRKDRDGFIRAELDLADRDGIPVTPRYYDQISSMI